LIGEQRAKPSPRWIVAPRTRLLLQTAVCGTKAAADATNAAGLRANGAGVKLQGARSKRAAPGPSLTQARLRVVRSHPYLQLQAGLPHRVALLRKDVLAGQRFHKWQRLYTMTIPIPG
jgi:hypothetical protein